MKKNKNKFDEIINFLLVIVVGSLLSKATNVYFWFASGVLSMVIMYLLAYIKNWKHQNTVKTSIGLIFGGIITLLIVLAFAILLELNKRKNFRLSSKEELKLIVEQIRTQFFLREGFLGIGTITRDDETFIEISVINEEAYHDILGFMSYHGYNNKIYKIIIRDQTKAQ